MLKKLLFMFILITQVALAQPINIVPGDTLSIQPIGDSITRGTEGVTYRQYLKELLKGINVPIDFRGLCENAANSGSKWSDYPDLYNTLEGDIEHDGYGGLKTHEITDMRYNTRGYPTKTIEQLVTDASAQVILLMAGTNDIIGNYQLTTFVTRYDTLITRILRVAKGHLIVTSIPPTPLPITNGKIVTLNGDIKKVVDAHIAKGENLSFIDINSMMVNSEISADSYHPNKSGYEKIGTGFFQAIQKIVTDVKDEKKSEEMPNEFGLMQNYPNPFNPVTVINYSLPNQSKVHLAIFDLLGRELTTLVNKEQAGGNYQVQFNASNLASGVYYYRLSADNFIQSKKMIVLK
ncbi:MAG: GDSL-type esterase/lipase family protein [Melioribacteraceae bacterium]|nr:GDSL-type esterase/lipase family protein [Melioribacteraceae bacterium]